MFVGDFRKGRKLTLQERQISRIIMGGRGVNIKLLFINLWDIPPRRDLFVMKKYLFINHQFFIVKSFYASIGMFQLFQLTFA